MASEEDLERLRAARIAKEKKEPKYLRRTVPLPPRKKPITKLSEKKRNEKTAEKKMLSAEGFTEKEAWFQECRRAMTGTCQCGCGEPSQKWDDDHFRSSAAHIFPKKLFKSIRYHPYNWVERRVWAGRNGTSACHSIMDDTSMQRWPGMADWEDIKAKFYILAPLLTPEEKAKKFYLTLEKLVHDN